MSGNVIEVNNLTKRYDGITVVNGIFKLKTPVTVSDVYAPGFVSK